MEGKILCFIKIYRDGNFRLFLMKSNNISAIASLSQKHFFTELLKTLFCGKMESIENFSFHAHPLVLGIYIPLLLYFPIS